MSDIMAVLLNGIAQIEFDRNKFVPPEHKVYLDRMDQKMDHSIELDGQTLLRPDLGQRARFVANLLAQAIAADNEAQVAASTSWLALRLPDLQQVNITETGARFTIDLIFDQPYVKQQPLVFKHSK